MGEKNEKEKDENKKDENKKDENKKEKDKKVKYKKERKKDSLKHLQEFQHWLEDTGPIDIIIDGANVGYYNTHTHLGGMLNYHQLDEVAQYFQKKKQRVCIIMNQRHFKTNSL